MADIDWTESMQQTFEFYTVDPVSWTNETKLTDVTSCSITRDSENELLESATIDRTSLIDECYIRIYLVCIQNGVKYSFPLGTFLVQTPSIKYDGKVRSMSLEAYSSLIELKDSKPPYGYSLLTGVSILETASDLAAEVSRAPVVGVTSTDTLTANFVSDFDQDSWLSYLTDLIGSVNYRFCLDELGRILFAPKSDPKALQPIWEFNDDNSSILLPEITLTRDLYSIPNVVEVLYSSDTGYKFARAVNDDDNSPISTVNRGREVVHRVTNPEDLINPSQAQINTYAEDLLKDLSAVEYQLSYSHGYCPVRVGDCVMLNYERAGITNVRAVVKSQSIECSTGCVVNETAVFMDNTNKFNLL